MGILTVTGIGPGNKENMTLACLAALEAADIIIGYTAYIELVRPLFPEKKYRATGMKGEVERCCEALKLAANGADICLVSSGDSGVYGMAGLVLELAADFPGVQVKIIPGLSAAFSGGALLGAPLGHDFAVISLSDLLTPWETIEKRLRAAAAGDFAICIYNPSSRKRYDYLKKASAVLLETLPENRICGITRCIGRIGESCTIITLKELQNDDTLSRIDMFCTVFIGNSQTKIIDIGAERKMVTPRGYKHNG
jgi:precorrin-3B C17-methyltransferase